MNKKEIRTKRLDIIHQLSRLEAVHCRNCPKRSGGAINRLPEKTCKGCPIFPQIRALGDEMDELANINKTFNLPTDLNIQTYNFLVDQEWTNLKIRKHYGLTAAELNYFLKMNKQRKKERKKTI